MFGFKISGLFSFGLNQFCDVDEVAIIYKVI
jgi:hypothetical protein